MTVDRWKLTSYCSCNPSTTRGHFEKSDDDLAVWVVLSDHEAEIAARDQALAKTREDSKLLRAALSEALGNYAGLRTLLRSVQINAVVPDELMADIEHAIGAAPEPQSEGKSDV